MRNKIVPHAVKLVELLGLDLRCYDIFHNLKIELRMVWKNTFRHVIHLVKGEWSTSTIFTRDYVR